MGVVTNWTVPSVLLRFAFPTLVHRRSFISVNKKLDDSFALFKQKKSLFYPLLFYQKCSDLSHSFLVVVFSKLWSKDACCDVD